jgi:hypothetical protein
VSNEGEDATLLSAVKKPVGAYSDYGTVLPVRVETIEFGGSTNNYAVGLESGLLEGGGRL